MPRPGFRARPLDVTVTAALDRVRDELDISEAFPEDVLAEAASLPDPREDPGRVDRRDLPLVTIDPPGSTDLDQALAIDAGPRGGHVVWYAIADVAAFVVPGGAIDREARHRGVTLYAPDGRAPLHPPTLSEDAGSLLPGQDRPAVLWRLALDPDGVLVDTTVGRAVVRSREQLTYDEAQSRIEADDAALVPLRTIGLQREAAQIDRGGIHLPIPDQEVVRDDGHWHLRYRPPRPVESWNAQVSLLCGMAAADLSLAGGWGLLRTLPPATDEAMSSLRRHAAALGLDWPDQARAADVIAHLDPADEAAAAFLVQATQLFRGADYLPVRPGAVTSQDVLIHSAIAAPYAHVTAPLRRLGDRFATEAVLAAVNGNEPPEWVQSTLDDLPGMLRAASARASALERAVVDLFEALLLADRVGEELAGVVVDHRRDGSVLQCEEPAVVAIVDGIHPLGSRMRARIVAVDVETRRVTLDPLEAGSVPSAR